MICRKATYFTDLEVIEYYQNRAAEISLQRSTALRFSLGILEAHF